MLAKIITGLVVLVMALVIFLETYTPGLSENHGKVQAKLFTGEGNNQPLIVGFGGGEGGNAWAGDYWKPVRDQFLDQEYAFLAIGYFGMESTPAYLDRISLDAIHDTIMAIAQNPKIDPQKIALIGGSKGAELVLNLASRYSNYRAVVGIVPSHVSFPATDLTASTSSWSFHDEEVPYVPMPWAAVPAAIKRDLHEAFSIMLENREAVVKATIPVENINGPLLLVSATHDEMWPSTQMSAAIVKRLREKNFRHYYSHIPIDGGHTEPLKHFDLIFEFFSQHLRDKSYSGG